jgi:hypothetical protein
MKLLIAAIVLCAASARAEDVKPVRVGASHRVDVIAPGERVETAIDRMRRAMGPPREISPRPAFERLAPRGPGGRAERTATERAAPTERGSSAEQSRPAVERATPVDAPRQSPLPQQGTGNPTPTRR